MRIIVLGLFIAGVIYCAINIRTKFLDLDLPVEYREVGAGVWKRQADWIDCAIWAVAVFLILWSIRSYNLA